MERHPSVWLPPVSLHEYSGIPAPTAEVLLRIDRLEDVCSREHNL